MDKSEFEKLEAEHGEGYECLADYHFNGYKVEGMESKIIEADYQLVRKNGDALDYQIEKVPGIEFADGSLLVESGGYEGVYAGLAELESAVETKMQAEFEQERPGMDYEEWRDMQMERDANHGHDF